MDKPQPAYASLAIDWYKNKFQNVLAEIEENVHTCCAITMDPDEVESLIYKLRNLDRFRFKMILILDLILVSFLYLIKVKSSLFKRYFGLTQILFKCCIAANGGLIEYSKI